MTFSLFIIIVTTSTIVIIVTTRTVVIIVTTRTIIRVRRGNRFKQLLWKFKTLRANCAHGHF